MNKSTYQETASRPYPASHFKAYVLLTLAPLFMATNPVIGKAATDIVPPIAMSFWRWLLASTILLLFAWKDVRLYASTFLEHWKLLTILGALGMGVCGAFVYIGLHSTTAINGGLIYAASPILILILNSRINREGIHWFQMLGVALAVAGVLAILFKGELHNLLKLEFTNGDWWIVCGMVAWAFYSVMLKSPALKGIPVIALFACIAVAGTLVQLPFYVWETLTQASVVWTLNVFASIAGVAVVSSVIAFGCYQKGIADVGAAKAGPFMYLMPVYGTAMAVLFLRESFYIFHAVGLVLVITGVVLCSLNFSKPA